MKYLQFSKCVLILVTASALLFNCSKKKEEDPVPVTETPAPVVRKTSYPLNVRDFLGVSGTATFTEKSGTETIIDIQLSNITTAGALPYIMDSSAVEGGNVKITLNPLDATGKSSTIVTKLDNGTAINYSQLISFDGKIDVKDNALLSNKLYAQGDIGGNMLISDKKTYPLTSLGGLGVDGNFTIQKRANGTTLAVILLNGTVNGGSHPAHIHVGSTTTNGPIVLTFPNVSGLTGGVASSIKNIRKLDDGSEIKYDKLLIYTGYLNVHKSNSELGVIIAQGNIGSNAN